VSDDPVALAGWQVAGDRRDRRLARHAAAMLRLLHRQRRILLAERGAGSEEQRLRGVARDTEDGRDLLVPKAVDVLEDEHGTVSLGEPGERLLELPAELRLLEGVDVQRARVVLCIVDGTVEPACAQMVVAGVHGDAVEPGSHAEVVAGRQLPECLQEDVLGDVACILAALHDPQGQIEDAPAVRFVEHLERILPAGPEARNEAALGIRAASGTESSRIPEWCDAGHVTYDIGIPAEGHTSACCSKDTSVEAETLSACDKSSPDVRSSGMHSSLGNQRRRARERRRNHIRRRRAIALAVFVTLIILAVWAAYAIPGATPARVPQGASRSAFDQAPAGAADIVVASVGGIDILLPVARAATTAVAFHPVENAGTVAFTPAGDGAGGGAAKYYLMSGDGADRSAATAGLDVGAVPGSAVVSPVDGRVTAVKQYQLLGRYADTEIDIQITGDPSLLLVMTHLAGVKVHLGDSVIRGDTTLGAVRGFPTGLEQALSQYTSDAGDHVQLVVLRVSSQLAGF